jgi:hypothetical protein
MTPAAKPATPPRKAVALAFFNTAATSTLAFTSSWTLPFFCFTAVRALEAVTEAVARVTDAVLTVHRLRSNTAPRPERSSWGRRCCLRISRRA